MKSSLARTFADIAENKESKDVIFPERVPIGSIKNIRKNADDGFFDVSVSLFEDFNQLNYVYIIHSDEAAEQLKLEQKIPEDE